MHHRPTPGPGRSAISVWTRLGDDFVGFETSRVGSFGVAATGHALYASADHGNDSQKAPLGSVGGVIRVVLVKEDHGWYVFFGTDPNASV